MGEPAGTADNGVVYLRRHIVGAGVQSIRYLVRTPLWQSGPRTFVFSATENEAFSQAGIRAFEPHQGSA